MDNFLLVFICIFAAILLRETNILPKNAHQTINRIIIYLALPALVLYFIPTITFKKELIYALSMPWIAFAVSFALFFTLAKIYHWPKGLTMALILLSGLGNTSFLGIPVVQAMFGEHQVKNVLIIDQAGTFVVLSTVGLLVCFNASKEKGSLKSIITKLLKFPPFLTFLFSLSLNFLDIALPTFLVKSSQSIGALVVPLALMSIGLQLRLERNSLHWNYVALGLVCKLILIPAVVFSVYKVFMGLNTELIKVVIIESAMPPMVTAGIVAASYGIKPRFCGILVGYGIPISLITLAFWYWVVQLF